MVVLGGVSDGEDDFDEGVERSRMMRAEVGANVKVELVVSGGENVPAQQGAAAAVGVGEGRTDLMPGAIPMVVERDGDIGGGPAEMRVENMR